MFRFMRILKETARLNLIRTMSSDIKLKKVSDSFDCYVWIDLEMTGLDENIHKIVEVACVLTNSELDILHEGFHMVIHQPKEVFEQGNEWTKLNFPVNGLMKESLSSKTTVEEADKMLNTYIKEHTKYMANQGRYYLSGNSVYMDKRFLEKYMKNVNEMLHFRLIDVSTIKTLCSNWYPEKIKALPLKKGQHRALSDIMESIDELKLYRQHFFQSC